MLHEKTTCFHRFRSVLQRILKIWFCINSNYTYFSTCEWYFKVQEHQHRAHHEKVPLRSYFEIFGPEERPEEPLRTRSGNFIYFSNFLKSMRNWKFAKYMGAAYFSFYMSEFRMFFSINLENSWEMDDNKKRMVFCGRVILGPG